MSARNFQIDSTRSRFGSVTIIRDQKLMHQDIIVRLYETNIVKVTRKTLVLNSGGWKTVTTKQAINRALQQVCEHGMAPFVRQSKGVWYVDFANGRTVVFRDGMRIPRWAEGVQGE